MNKKYVIIAIVAIILVLTGTAGVIIWQSSKKQNSPSNSDSLNPISNDSQIKRIKIKHTADADLTRYPQKNIAEIKKGDYNPGDFFNVKGYVVKIDDCLASKSDQCEEKIIISENSKKTAGENLSENELRINLRDYGFDDVMQQKKQALETLKDIKIGTEYLFLLKISVPLSAKDESSYGIGYGGNDFRGLSFINIDGKDSNYITVYTNTSAALESNIPMSKDNCTGQNKWFKGILIDEGNGEIQYCSCVVSPTSIILEGEMKECSFFI